MGRETAGQDVDSSAIISAPGCRTCSTSFSRLMNAMASRFSRPPNAIGNPFAGRARIIEIEHRGDRVHAQTVDVVLVDPEKRVREQEILHFVAAVIEDERAPIGMRALARVGVLVEMRAVEKCQAVRVAREMRGRPIEDHAEPFLVAAVDEDT